MWTFLSVTCRIHQALHCGSTSCSASLPFHSCWSKCLISMTQWRGPLAENNMSEADMFRSYLIWKLSLPNKLFTVQKPVGNWWFEFSHGQIYLDIQMQPSYWLSHIHFWARLMMWIIITKVAQQNSGSFGCEYAIMDSTIRKCQRSTKLTWGWHHIVH